MLLLVEVAGVPRRELDEILAALLLLEPAARLVVGRKDGTRRAELSDHVRDRSALCVAERVHPGTGELEDAAAAPADAAAAKQLQDHVLGLNPRAHELVLEEDADDLRARQLKRMPGHADRHVEPAGADCDHRARAGLGGVRVRADQRLPRLREPLAVDVVADPVSRSREPGAVFGGHRLEEAMIVGILEVDLEDVVIDVDDRRVDTHPLLAEEL